MTNEERKAAREMLRCEGEAGSTTFLFEPRHPVLLLVTGPPATMYAQLPPITAKALDALDRKDALLRAAMNALPATEHEHDSPDFWDDCDGCQLPNRIRAEIGEAAS